jgi:hypothetical protein
MTSWMDCISVLRKRPDVSLKSELKSGKKAVVVECRDLELRLGKTTSQSDTKKAVYGLGSRLKGRVFCGKITQALVVAK